MASDSVTAPSGNIAWDVGSNWSLGTVPQTTDTAVISNQSGVLSVSIAATDPAYTVAALTESTTSTSTPGAVLSVSGQLTVTGTTSITSRLLQVGNSGKITLNAVSVSNSAELLGGNDASSSLSIGSISGNGAVAGTIIVGTAPVSIASISGSVGITFPSNGTVNVGSLGGLGTIYFGPAGGRVNLQSSTSSLNDYIGPNNNSIIDLQNIGYQPGETATETLVSNNGFFSTYSIALTSVLGQSLYTFQNVFGYGQPGGPQSAPPVTVASDTATGTLVTLACYTAGTRIAVPGAERPVQDLAIGDAIVTASGQLRRIKWVGHRSYGGRFLQANRRALPIRFRAGALADGIPRAALLVSPEHAMFIDGVLVPARCLVNGASIAREPRLDHVEYFHIELDTHDVILAEGAPSETFVDDKSRMMFHNASEFAALYPGQARVPALYCAPRIEHGDTLAKIRRRIDARAGLGHAVPGALRGFVDTLDGRTLTGWAQDVACPEAPVCLDVLVNGTVVAQAVADRFRSDLLAAGLGSGCHSFCVRLPKATGPRRVDVRRSADGVLLGAIARGDRRAA